MNKLLALTKRNLKEISRDPVSLCFCILAPIVMLVAMQLIFGKTTAEGASMFQIENFAPAIVTFGFSFTALYVALTVSGDNGSSFITRIKISPVKPYIYLLSQILSALPLMAVQTVLFYAISLIFGLKVNLNLLVSMVYLIPIGFFYLSAGILIGVIVKSEKQAGPVSSILITGAGLLGGVWMPLESIGGGFLTLCKILPFYNGVTLSQMAVKGDFNGLIPFLITLAWTVVIFAVAVIIFKVKSKK